MHEKQNFKVGRALLIWEFSSKPANLELLSKSGNLICVQWWAVPCTKVPRYFFKYRYRRYLVPSFFYKVPRYSV